MARAASALAARGDAVPPQSGLRRIVLVAWTLTPALWLTTFISLLIRARLVLGEWPHARVGIPIAEGYSPATFGGDCRPIHGDFLNLIWPFALISPLWILANRQGWSSQRRTWFLAFALSYGLMLWIWFADPGSLMSWAAD